MHPEIWTEQFGQYIGYSEPPWTEKDATDIDESDKWTSDLCRHVSNYIQSIVNVHLHKEHSLVSQHPTMIHQRAKMFVDTWWKWFWKASGNVACINTLVNQLEVIPLHQMWDEGSWKVCHIFIYLFICFCLWFFNICLVHPFEKHQPKNIAQRLHLPFIWQTHSKPGRPALYLLYCTLQGVDG